jgi:hypothetical protein
VVEFVGGKLFKCWLGVGVKVSEETRKVLMQMVEKDTSHFMDLHGP